MRSESCWNLWNSAHGVSEAREGPLPAPIVYFHVQIHTRLKTQQRKADFSNNGHRADKKGSIIMSNYYVKGITKIGETVTLPIEADNVYTTCPGCGREHLADLEFLITQDPHFNFYDTRAYCAECSKSCRIEPDME